MSAAVQVTPVSFQNIIGSIRNFIFKKKNVEVEVYMDEYDRIFDQHGTNCVNGIEYLVKPYPIITDEVPTNTENEAQPEKPWRQKVLENGHELYSADDFEDGEEMYLGSLAQLVIISEIAVCKKCGCSEDDLDNYQCSPTLANIQKRF